MSGRSLCLCNSGYFPSGQGANLSLDLSFHCTFCGRHACGFCFETQSCTHMMLRDVLSVLFPVKITNDRDLFCPP